MGHDRIRAAALVAIALAMLSQAGARAQLPLPSVPPVPVPGLPGADLPISIPGAASDTLRTARNLRIRQLLRGHPRELERGAKGELIVRSEVLAFSPTEEALARATAAGFSVRRERELAGLGARIVVIAAPAGLSTRSALERLRQLDPAGLYDFNHIYLGSGEVEPAGSTPAVPPVMPVASNGGAAAAVRVGLIDTGLDSTLEVFARATIVSGGCDGSTVPAAHGTAVASLLVDALPEATVYAADVFCDLPIGGASDRIAAALDWMARENVAVVNASLVGPRNLLVEAATRLLVARGVLIVAAVGNDGPGALPLFPAAYPGVVGVTAVDAKDKVLLEACRGDHVDYASRGADLEAVGGANGRVPVRGTSFAAPLVAARLALALPQPDPVAARAALAELTHEAIDLGRKGRDIIYGDGFVAPIVVEQGRK